MHLNTWNEYQLNIQRTSYLLHHIYYGQHANKPNQRSHRNQQPHHRTKHQQLHANPMTCTSYTVLTRTILTNIQIETPPPSRWCTCIRHTKNYMGPIINRYHVPEGILSPTTILHSSLMKLAPCHLFVSYCFCPNKIHSASNVKTKTGPMYSPRQLPPHGRG